MKKTDSAVAVEDQIPVEDGPGIDEMLSEWDATEQEQQAEANRPDPEDLEKARKLAEKMNSGFLWVVERTQCPHIKIEQVVDREQGDEAFLELAERLGGEVPAWVQQFSPYIAAGVYMGSAIITARQAEEQALELIKGQKQEGAADGQEPGPQSEE